MPKMKFWLESAPSVVVNDTFCDVPGKKKVDEDCTVSDNDCLENGECRDVSGTDKCACKAGYTANDRKTSCG